MKKIKKIVASVVIAALCLGLTACNNGREINARNMKTANKSVRFIKERLRNDQRIEFEVSFWTLRNDLKSDDEFLDAIDGKTPEGLIDLGKEAFNKHKAANDKAYQKYATWEQMIAEYAKERTEQSRKSTTDEPEKANGSVLYQLSP